MICEGQADGGKGVWNLFVQHFLSFLCWFLVVLHPLYYLIMKSCNNNTQKETRKTRKHIHTQNREKAYSPVLLEAIHFLLPYKMAQAIILPKINLHLVKVDFGKGMQSQGEGHRCDKGTQSAIKGGREHCAHSCPSPTHGTLCVV